MKKITTFFGTLMFSCAIFAQNITLTYTNTHQDGTAADVNIPAINHIQNNTAADIDLYWQRQNVQIPAAWRTTVCDLNLCWGENISTMPFTLPPTPAHTDGELMEVQFRPYNTVGSGTCEVAIFDANTNAELTRCFYSVTAAAVGTVDITTLRFQIYPNPATEYLTVSGNSDIKTIKIYTAIGILATQFNVTNQQERYNIASLQPGSYLVEVSDAKGRVLQTSPIVKGF